jgi:hypothetical protein
MTTDMDAWDEYREAQKSDLAARYGGFKCPDCIYWYVENWRVEKAVLNDEDLNHETPRGECRRKAPIPQPLMALRVGQLAGSIAWAVETTARIPHSDDDDGLTDYNLEGNDVYEIDTWPLTTVNDWCGEGRPGRKPMSAETIAMLEALHAKAFPPEEEDDEAAPDDQPEPDNPG